MREIVESILALICLNLVPTLYPTTLTPACKTPQPQELVRDFEKLEADYANEAPPRDVGSLIRKQPV
jgi:hypothetical protein